MPESSNITDKCTECGFCESSCVSAGLTLTPRQRIAVHREMVNLVRNGLKPHISAALAKSYSYAGDATCAADGLCAINCPVQIDTGKLIKELRHQKVKGKDSLSYWLATHMDTVTSLARGSLSAISSFHYLLGTNMMKVLSSGMRRLSLNRIPLWNQYMPTGAKRINTHQAPLKENTPRVVYFPSCINRSMGVSKDHKDEVQLSEKTVHLLRKAGFEPVYPENLDKLCCGMAFSSKGYTRAGEMKSGELEAALLKASNNGEYPVLCDMSPCLFTMRENMKPPLRLFEPVEFITDFLMPRLAIAPLEETITVFPVCSMKKMGLDEKLIQLADLCARNVVVPETNCCGFAGDRGFNLPELNRHGLKDLKSRLNAVRSGYSTSRTCEIGLGVNTGISYKSIIYLVDEVTTPK